MLTLCSLQVTISAWCGRTRGRFCWLHLAGHASTGAKTKVRGLCLHLLESGLRVRTEANSCDIVWVHYPKVNVDLDWSRCMPPARGQPTVPRLRANSHPETVRVVKHIKPHWQRGQLVIVMRPVHGLNAPGFNSRSALSAHGKSIRVGAGTQEVICFCRLL